VAGTGNHLVDLESGQLSALTGLGTLCHLDLYLFGIDQVVGGDTEAARGHLLGLAVERDAVYRAIETVVALATLTGVGACAELVHGQGHGLVGFLAQCAERHGAGDKVLTISSTAPPCRC
jgi:hypothetical protein